MKTPQSEQAWHWQAIEKQPNIARDYRLSVSHDLFGWFIVEQRWGRVGTAGQGKTIAFADGYALARHIAAVRRRRASAQKRIGASYQELPGGNAPAELLSLVSQPEPDEGRTPP